MHKNFKTNKMTIETMLSCTQKCLTYCPCSCDCQDMVNSAAINDGMHRSSGTTPTDLLVMGASIG